MAEYNLLENLSRQIYEAGIDAKPISLEELNKIVMREEDDPDTRYLRNIVSTAITLVRSTGEEFDDAFPAIESGRLRTLRDVVEPIYRRYVADLRKEGEIDFHDMLFKASDIIDKGLHTHRYRYVIVDEYQDVSLAEQGLLKSMRKSKDYNLFCVGDDWQSIFRFRGGDVDYIRHFKDHWGSKKQYYVEKTYRFGGTILEVSNIFMNATPGQIRKDLRASKTRNSVVEILHAHSKKDYAELIRESLNGIDRSDTVFVLSRFNHNLEEVRKKLKDLDLKIEFLTIHKAKGRQADHVFILNNNEGVLGFPDLRPESELNNLILKNTGKKLEEERRLFYPHLCTS